MMKEEDEAKGEGEEDETVNIVEGDWGGIER